MKSSKKKVNLLTKIKRFFKKIVKIIGVSLVSLWESFMALSATVRYIVCIWVAVVLLIVGFVFLTLIIKCVKYQNYC